MSRFCCSAQIVAAALSAVALSGCGSIELFGTYDIAEDPAVAAAPWPRLIDTPPAPPAGTYTPAVPDPAEGVAAQADLGAAGAAANARAAELAAPVVPEAGRAGAPADRIRPAGASSAVPIPQAGRADGPSDSEIAAAAAARAAALAGPVIPESERSTMLEAATRRPPLSE